jgi:hypothetical protein
VAAGAAGDDVALSRRARRDAEPVSKQRMTTGFATLRDLVTFIAGLGIVLNEVFFSTSIEEVAVGVGFALMGLPVVFRTDERKK